MAAVLAHLRELISSQGWQASNWQDPYHVRPQVGPWSVFDAIRHHGCAECPEADWVFMGAVRSHLERFTRCWLPYWDSQFGLRKLDALRLFDRALLALGVSPPRRHRGGHVVTYFKRGKLCVL